MLAMAVLLAVLFPAPLHLTREVTDPITGGTTVVEVYCHGDRVVSVRGKKTAIAEYDKGVVTVIDADAGTYSVTKFDDLAKAWSSAKTTAAPMRVKGDDRHLLTRDAIEVLLGVAYPARRDATIDQTVGSLRAGRHRIAANSTDAAAAEYALPLEQVVQLDEDLELRNTITRVGDELAPPEALIIPAGSRLVESTAIGTRRMLDELDGRPRPR
jgi:hypothetical protein